jgi:hypothetical protein
MKKIKLYTDLRTTEEFIEYYKGAGRRELKSALKGIRNTQDQRRKNEREAIIALLA